MVALWIRYGFLVVGCLCLGAIAGPVMRHEVETDPELTAGYFQGDMDVELTRNGVLATTRHWPNATVYYKIDKEFDAAHIAYIELGMQLIELASCIRFMPASEENLNYVYIFDSESGCSSAVGYRGGEQNLRLTANNLDSGCFRLGTIQHELLHTLGFHHQQCSPNRDDFVQIVEENISEGKEKNFLKYDYDVVGDFDVAYDYGSILHYGPKAFSKNGKETIIALHPDGKSEMGQRTVLSPADVTRLNTMYKCPLQV
ncbi:seminal metalloprotease 1 [Drosophila grimshawi]|uniref:Metalloendopeptidase n=1 Tax=Drosophila grimshawi TaxID=7222 RepID=B4JQV7_DROGR|nr:seminal metalloprotease 1 [Drosophila grimshawi]EDV99287.1 GH13765 [Drosophila grimshawi]